MQIIRVAQFFMIGYAGFGKRAFVNNQANFTPNALDVDLSGKHYIVTGATSGLGRETASQIARRGAYVHLLCRNAQRGEQVRSQLVDETGNSQIQLHVCDISSLNDVASFSKQWIASGVPIAALVNNAGAMIHQRKDSKDGFELNFATNTLGTFALTEMLLPALQNSPSPRVITVSSGGMLTEQLEITDLEGQKLLTKNGIDGSSQYAKCKRRQVALTEYWARHYSDRGIFWASMHPGWANTPGLEVAMPEFHNFMKNQLRTSEQGADTIIYLAISDEALELKSGDFIFDRKPSLKHLFLGGTMYKESATDDLARKLRNLIVEKGYDLPN